MKLLTKKFATAAVAASLVLGGSSTLLSSEASAQSITKHSTVHTSQAKKSTGASKKSVVQNYDVWSVSQLVTNTASVLKIDANTVYAELANHSTLAKIAEKKGMTSKDFAQKLLDIANADIDAAAKDGHIKSAKAAKSKQNIQKFINKQITNPKLYTAKHPAKTAAPK